MGRAQFEYDEVGNTFYYVLVSFYALVLIPATFFFWPSSKSEKTERKEHCNCEGCTEKRARAEAKGPWRRTKKFLTFLALAVAWILFFVIVHKVTQIEVEHTEYDPYGILGIDQGASIAVVKKKYRELSKTMHPDKGGDPVQFDRIAKAYQALTDEESRENWEKYGNPDGPTATTFGIALPKWIVSKEYGVWVLAFYGFVLMVLLPSAVGFWWYNSIKYSIDQVLLDTTEMYYYFFHKTPKMEINRIIMVLGGSFEFWRQYNKEIVERESDDIELPPLLKQVKNLGENKKERPLCLPYAVKARFFIHSHLSRIAIDSFCLRSDSAYVISKCVMLASEMLAVAQHLYFYGNPAHCPPLETIENLVKLLPMVVQALWPKNSPLLQLPHITEQNLHYFRRNRIITCSDLANLNEIKRRQVLQSLSDAEYNDIVFVLQSMPRLNIVPHFEVQGEVDAQKVTVGSVVTLKVALNRIPLLDPNKRDDEIREADGKYREPRTSMGAAPNKKLSTAISNLEEAERAEVVDDEEEANEEKPKRKVWEKPKKKQNKTKPTKHRPGQKTRVQKKAAVKPENNKGKLEEQKDKKENNDDVETVGCSENEEPSGSEKGYVKDENDSGSERTDEEESDNEDWADGNMTKKESILENRSKKTHPVHCPHFPGEKFEWWWLLLIDKKLRKLVVPAVHCTTLVDDQSVEIKFAAPQNKGIYYYSLLVKSDSYMDCDYSLDLKLDVHEAKEVPIIKYEDSEEEERLEDSSDYTEDSESEHE